MAPLIPLAIKAVLSVYVTTKVTAYATQQIAALRGMFKTNDNGETELNVQPYTFTLTAEELSRVLNNDKVGHVLRTAKRRDEMLGGKLRNA